MTQLKKVFLLLVTLFSSVFLGIEYVEPPSKVFIEGAYYEGFDNTESPDYRLIYQKYNASSIVSQEASTKDARPLERGYKPFMPAGEKNFMWLWGIKYADHTDSNGDILENSFTFLEEYSTTNPKGWQTGAVGPDTVYYWIVPEGTRLTAFADGYLSANEQYLETPYPESGMSKGVNMSIIHIRETDEGSRAFRVTYMSMKRWWVDLDKKNPDKVHEGNDTKPLYGHDLVFTKDDRFYPGSVIGEAGRTGVSDQILGTVVTARFSSCGVTDGVPTGDWSPLSLNDFYGFSN